MSQIFQELRTKYCQATSSLRRYPDFIIIGAQKSGTTSLYHYLAQHPEILVNIKEVHYFDNNFHKGNKWYLSNFPITLRYFRRKGAIAGEATPYYICHPHAPWRIKELLPHIRLIAVLRNPVDRAISHYFHEVKKGRETLPIMEALEKEEERCGQEWQTMIADPSYNSTQFQRFSYKRRGIYVDQLRRYWECFSREQLCIVNSDDMFRDPQEVLRKIFHFLGIDQRCRIPDLKVRNANTAKKNVPPEVSEYLSS